MGKSGNKEKYNREYDMRIHLKLTPNEKPVPFTYQEELTGLLFKWLKDSSLHEGISLYSFSQLSNGILKNGHLEFQKGSQYFISCWEVDTLKILIESIRNDSEFAFGMRVTDIVIQENPDLSNINYFRIASPILIHRLLDGKHRYLYFDDDDSEMALEQTIHTKMKAANLEHDELLHIEFDKHFSKAQKKRINYKGISNPVSICPVIINGKNLTKQFIWNVGLGNSTGIGFGAIY